MKASAGSKEQTILSISRQIGRRAGNLFLTKQLWCSGAVLVALNRALDGDLTQDQAIRLAAGLGEGMGGGGCVCGGLSGAALALGLFLGNGRLSPGGDQKVLKATRLLHDQFKHAQGSVCCRVLLKKNAGGQKAHYHACAQRTGKAAELCAELILNRRPELISKVDWEYLNQKDGVASARVKIVADNLRNLN